MLKLLPTAAPCSGESAGLPRASSVGCFQQYSAKGHRLQKQRNQLVGHCVLGVFRFLIVATRTFGNAAPRIQGSVCHVSVGN